MVAHLTAHKLDIFDAVSVEVTALQRASATSWTVTHEPLAGPNRS
jgi:hypothetical protein